MKRITQAFLIGAAALSLSACGVGASDEMSDDALLGANGAVAGNDTDPAMAGALEDQIMVDPQLAGSANRNAVRPTDQPARGPIPPDMARGGGTPGDRAAAMADASTAVGGKMMKAPAPTKGEALPNAETLGALAREEQTACGAKVDYNLAWAQKLPAEFPVYPRSAVSEAAGVAGKCNLRVVSFSTAAPLEAVIDWYYTRARQAGYSAEHELRGTEHWLGGARDRDGGAFVLMVNPRADGGAEVDLVYSNGG